MSISRLRRNRKSDYLPRDGFIYLNGDWLLSTKDTERSELSQGNSKHDTVKKMVKFRSEMLIAGGCEHQAPSVEASASSQAEYTCSTQREKIFVFWECPLFVKCIVT